MRSVPRFYLSFVIHNTFGILQFLLIFFCFLYLFLVSYILPPQKDELEDLHVVIIVFSIIIAFIDLCCTYGLLTSFLLFFSAYWMAKSTVFYLLTDNSEKSLKKYIFVCEQAIMLLYLTLIGWFIIFYAISYLHFYYPQNNLIFILDIFLIFTVTRLVRFFYKKY